MQLRLSRDKIWCDDGRSRPAMGSLRVCVLVPAGAMDVNNFRLDDFLTANRAIAEAREIFRAHSEARVGSLTLSGMGNKLHWVELTLQDLGLYASAEVAKALDRFKQKETLCAIIAHHLDDAVQAIDYQIKTEWTYHYGGQTESIAGCEERWRDVIVAFPSSYFEIWSALDCFALQHHTAAVFHFMRAAEYGLRRLAIELAVTLPKGKPLTHANWQEIITHCDRQLKEIGQAVPAGDAKSAALAFYSNALAHLHYLKDNFRNDVMHAKSVFDVDQAVNASRGTKQLLDLLASRLAEKVPKKGFKNGKIDWGF